MVSSGALEIDFDFLSDSKNKTGEKKLLAACIGRAIFDAVDEFLACGEGREAWAYLNGRGEWENPKYLYSMSSICRHLNLDFDAVKKALHHRIEKASPEALRALKNGNRVITRA